MEKEKEKEIRLGEGAVCPAVQLFTVDKQLLQKVQCLIYSSYSKSGIHTTRTLWNDR